MLFFPCASLYATPYLRVHYLQGDPADGRGRGGRLRPALRFTRLKFEEVTITVAHVLAREIGTLAPTLSPRVTCQCVILCAPIPAWLAKNPASQRWGGLFPQNAWESALPAACRPPQTGPLFTTGLVSLFFKHPSSPEQIQDLHEIASSAPIHKPRSIVWRCDGVRQFLPRCPPHHLSSKRALPHGS